MKRFFIAFTVLAALLAGSPALAAMPSYQETVTPAGHDASITAIWKGTPDSGAAVLPVPAKAKLVSVSIGSTPAEAYSLTKIDGDPVLSVTVPATDTAADALTVTAVWTLKGLFTPPDGKAEEEGPTKRGDIEPLKYGFANTTPRNFAKAELRVQLPETIDLFQIASPSKAKFAVKDGIWTASYSLAGKGEAAGLVRGGKVELSLVLIPKQRGGSFLLWGCVLLLGALFLFARRDIIAPKKDAA